MNNTLSTLRDSRAVRYDVDFLMSTIGLEPHELGNAFALRNKQVRTAALKKEAAASEATLRELVRETYSWANPQHETAALEYLEGLFLAAQQELWTQVQLYEHKIKELVTRDVVMRVIASSPQNSMVVSFTYEHSDRPSGVFSAFFSSKNWRFHPINDFNKLIPPPALQVLAALYKVGIVPDNLWVAEEQQKIDPILFASFGCSFVALAIWM